MLGFFIGATLLVALGAAMSFWTVQQIKEAAAARNQSYKVIRGAEDLLSALTDTETGTRGFLLTGDAVFLQPYETQHKQISGQLKALRNITALETTKVHLDALIPLVAAKLAGMSRIIELRQDNQIGAAIAAVSSGEGRKLMDAIRVEIADSIQLEEGLLARRDAGFENSMRNLFVAITTASFLALIYALTFAYMMRRYNVRTIKSAVHLETLRLLDVQEALNKELHETNLKLLVSEASLSVTLNSIGDAVIATDAEARITFLNPSAEELTGWNRADASGRAVEEVFNIINQETRLPAAVPIIATLEHGTTQGMTNHTILVARGGVERSIADSCAPIRGAAGTVVGAVLVFRDVTEEYAAQKTLHDIQAENQTILTDKNTALELSRSAADKANLAKSDFLSAMSHELRTPLNAILGFAQLMQSGAPPPSPAQMRSLEQILKAGWYLLELINEILDLALIESGKATLSNESVSLAEVMLECRAMIEPQAHKRGLSMTFPRFDVPTFVAADRVRLKQVLINLLFNAVKYNRPEGAVTVQSTLSAPDTLRISIRDTGMGLNSDQLAHLFQPFNRLGKETGAEEGTGIGLVVAKRLIELMGGTIGVESVVGEGSMFWIDLTLTTAPRFAIHDADEDTLQEQPPAPHGPLRTVLYVEDNTANLELVEQLIARREDLRLLSAADGALGIDFARTYLPDVILMDINLPGINGIDAMKILRTDTLTAHIPIVALSANAVPRDIEKALEAGFFNYLTKPIRVNQFFAALDGALKSSRKSADQPTQKDIVQ